MSFSYLFAPVDGASLGAFRICFGTLVAFEVMKYFAAGWIYRYYVQPQFYFSYLPFIRPLPDPFMHLIFLCMFALAALVALGLWFRASSALLTLGLSYVFLLDKANYLNHMYLICLLSFLITLTPADHALSVAAARAGPRTVPRWSLLILRAQIMLVFFFAGVAKLNSDWLAGYPQVSWLAERRGLPFLGPVLNQPWAGAAVTFGGIAIDLSVGFLLAWRRTFWLGATIVTVFLLTNGLLFNIGIFPYLMIAAIGLFADPSYPRRFLKRAKPLATSAPVAGERLPPTGRDMVVVAFLSIYLVVQIALPLRHWLYPGNVDWTEDGHRFAWRMMLRDKGVRFMMYAVNPETGRRRPINPLEYLTARQAKVMGSKPDMIVQFAHHVADLEEQAEGVRPRVVASIEVSLNGRPYQALVDRERDLAAIPLDGRPASSWVMALPPTPPGR